MMGSTGHHNNRQRTFCSLTSLSPSLSAAILIPSNPFTTAVSRSSPVCYRLSASQLLYSGNMGFPCWILQNDFPVFALFVSTLFYHRQRELNEIWDCPGGGYDIGVFWDMASCLLVSSNRRFRSWSRFRGNVVACPRVRCSWMWFCVNGIL
jgi:hypothetical protein